MTKVTKWRCSHMHEDFVLCSLDDGHDGDHVYELACRWKTAYGERCVLRHSHATAHRTGRGEIAPMYQCGVEWDVEDFDHEEYQKAGWELKNEVWGYAVIEDGPTIRAHCTEPEGHAGYHIDRDMEEAGRVVRAKNDDKEVAS